MNSFNSLNNNIANKYTTPFIYSFPSNVIAKMSNIAFNPVQLGNASGYHVYTFTSNGTIEFINSAPTQNITVILVGGGGGGGSGKYRVGGGGGGGGGVGYGTLNINVPKILNITIGIGGLGNLPDNNLSLSNVGGNTIISGDNIYEIVYGGGAGQNIPAAGYGYNFYNGITTTPKRDTDISCGSGGGACNYVNTNIGGINTPHISNNLLFYDSSGGRAVNGTLYGYNSASNTSGGGGGGAGSNGNANISGSNHAGGAGGNGKSFLINGITYGYYGAGGGGGGGVGTDHGKGGEGGTNGGGKGSGYKNGADYVGGVGYAGTNNTGGGGGGGGGLSTGNTSTTPYMGTAGFNGGSGICIIFVPIKSVS